MSSRRLLQQAFGLTLAVLLLAGCGGVPAGTLKGTLVDKSDQPVSGISLKLLTMTSQEGGKLDLEDTQHKATTDENGNFTFTDVESGKYVIVVLSFSFALGQEPTFDLNKQVLRDNNEEVLIIELPRSNGVDLGKLIWDK